MGTSLWELYLLEHGIGDDGVLSAAIKKSNKKFYENAYDTIFHETDHGQLVPRSVFVDLEPTVIGVYFIYNIFGTALNVQHKFGYKGLILYFYSTHSL